MFTYLKQIRISIVENSLEVRNGMLLSKRAMVLFIIYLVPNLALVIACCVIEVQSDHEQPYLETITRVYGFFLCSTTSLIMFLIWIFLFIHYFKLPDYSKKKHFFFFISSLIFSITVLGVVFSLFVIEWNLSCFFGYLGFSVTMLYELELVFLLFQVDKDILIKFFHPNYSPPATSNISNSTGAIKDEITDGGATTGNIEA
ncbi:hypothetical protein CYY_010089 [Polysphondylium violaceum]|uniref:Transmembrane protein n=1 Tax=Polysphondylium violaceum TaxID=133409 RepID=A0A8J4PLX4_9MYCE|nr:hypothetical protein CYY_010089 [Polysphondylium violaceum]